MKKTNPRKIIILGAAGRDFHNFNTFFRKNSAYKVVCFTATQIPNISNRRYPPELSGKRYPKGIPIYPEERLCDLIKKFKADEVVFSYSDVPYSHIMHIASLVNSCGANFRLLGPKETMIKSRKPIIAVTAVRTGCGKSQATQKIADILKRSGKRVVVIRHPMPYGNLKKQICQRFASDSDLKKHKCTIEEMEEYMPHIEKGIIVYAGVDYEKIIRAAEKEADVIIFDGGNNDFPFYVPDIWFVLLDPLRPGHEIAYYPGEINLRMADVAVINKISMARSENIKKVRSNIINYNPKAKIIETSSVITVAAPALIRNKKVLVVEDGPTLTHGEMNYGAGIIAARRYGAKTVEPRKHAVGSLKKIYTKYPKLKSLIPAMGYSEKQMKELQRTINNVPCDTIVNATPVDLIKVIKLNKPVVKISYVIEERGKIKFKHILKKLI